MLSSIRVAAVRAGFSTDDKRSSESGGLVFPVESEGDPSAGAAERSAEARRRDARERQGEAPGASGEMQFTRRIALLAHDALLSRRRAVPVNLSGEVARKASARHCHDASLSGKPIRRRRIEFNKPMERTKALVTPLAGASGAPSRPPAGRSRRSAPGR